MLYHHAVQKNEVQALDTLELVTQQMSAAVARCSRDFRYVWANQTYSNWIQRSLNNIVGRPLLEVLGKDQFEAQLPHFNRVLAGEALRYEQETSFPGVGSMWISAAYTPTLDADGAPDGWLAVMVDITERRRAEQALRESEERMRLAAQAGRMFAYSWDAATDVIERSGESAEILGVERTAVVTGADVIAMVHPDDKERLQTALAKLTVDSPRLQITYRMIRPDGRVTWLDRNSCAYFDDHGKIKRIVGMIIDITERKRAEESLRKSEELFRLAAQAGKMYAYEWDVDSDVIIRSGDVCGVLGSAGEALLTRQQLTSRVHPEDRARWSTCIAELAPDHPDVQISYRLLSPDGPPVWLEKTAHAFFDKDGRMVRMIGMVTNITQRKRAEVAIRESEMRYRRIVETTNEGVWLLDSNLCNSYVNQQLADMLGYEPGEMLGRSVFDFYFSQDVERKKEVLNRRRQGLREQIEERLRRKDGSELWARIAGTPVFRDDGDFDGALAMVSDITQRKRAEQTLRQSEEKFRSVFRDAGVGMVIVSPEGRFLAANKTFCEYLGYTEQELLAKTVESVTFQEDWPPFAQKLREILSDGGSFRWFEKRCLHKSGRIVYTESSASLIRSSESGPQYFVGEVLDITKRKAAEAALSVMTRKLVEAQEQERARIARELHDDINQRLALLTIELGQLKDRRNDLPPEVRSRVHELREQAAQITRDLQTLGYDLHSSQLDYLGIVGAMTDWCKQVGDRQKLEIDFKSHDVPTLPEDISLCLFRVLQEALHNAAKHSGAKRIEVQLVGNPGEIALTVRDSGKGFDLEAARCGRGLGLTSMQERIRLVGGTIAFDSKPQAGTVIDVHVPFRAQRSGKAAAG